MPGQAGPTDRHRHHSVKAKVPVHQYPDGTLAVWPAATPMANRERRVTRFDATGRTPVDKGTSAPDHFPTRTTTTTDAGNRSGTWTGKVYLLPT